MCAAKTVRVDNWGIYVLQRFKHFFNRTDYCDLTLQFQDNAQLKVHRLMLSSCTEYFEVLERTCEMYEDCLVMPDDLQADVVVPIINFMYTGQLEFRMELLEKLHACSEIMNMPVLTKLLDSHRPKVKTTHSYTKKAKLQNMQTQQVNQSKFPPTASLEVIEPTVSTSNKRSHAKAFETTTHVVLRDKKHQHALNKTSVMNVTTSGVMYRPPSPVPLEVLGRYKPQKSVPGEPRPTRYELPEDLDSDNLFENSFTNISYTSQPLMIHPERKQYAKRPKQDKGLASTSKKSNALDIVECKKVRKEPEDSLFEETSSSMISDEVEMFRNFDHVNVKTECNKDPNQLFDQLLDEEEHSAKVTIETPKNNKSANLDHAKIISEVLKKYPHLVKNNKNIKLKIFNNPTPTKAAVKKQKLCHQPTPPVINHPANMNMGADSDYTYETDVIDSKQAARLIALGAENIEGPWICLICGTPGKALHFTSYYKFRRHLVDVHKEKPVQNICEHCGQRMSKRNHLLHHLYSKHGVVPPSTHHFPKCQYCNYIALNEALLVKHKFSHIENKNFRCNVCPSIFSSSKMLLAHIQSTGHKYIADRKLSHQCIYCLRVFIRENNLYAHLKTHHKVDAIKDGIIDASDDESRDPIEIKYEPIKNEVDDMEYHIQQTSNGNIQLIPKMSAEKSPTKQTILNTGLTPVLKDIVAKSKATKAIHDVPAETVDSSFDSGNVEEIVMIDNNEYIMSGDRLILKNAARQPSQEFILSDLGPEKSVPSQQSVTPSTSMDYATMINTNENIQQALMKNAGNLAESIPIYVSNEEEYKALIAANHNIIFDSADENKTLTVLTTSENATLNNTDIDLDNAQNSDMMIIQDYPLNASEEAVVTENSNIVVVYSQQVGDPTKGYQLTTQALDPQYASGILTHNYETVSTASLVSHAQILDSPGTTWQGENPQNINATNSGAILQSIVQPEGIKVSNAQESNDDINNLPEVQLETVINQPAVISQIEETQNDTPSETLQPETEVIQSAQIIPMQVGEPVVTIENEIDNVKSNSENVETVLSQNEHHQTENIDEMETQEIEQIPESENISEVETEIIRMDITDTLTTYGSAVDKKNQNETEETVHEPILEANAEQDSNKNDVIATEVVQEIHTLASEWSEEDMSQDAIDNTKNKIRADAETEVEESIENIQHELEKQTAKKQDKAGNDEDMPHKIPSQESNESGTNDETYPKVKISSLLNDWEDSQEDNGINKSEPTELNTEITVTSSDVNPNKPDESLDDSSTVSEYEIMENPPADPETNITVPGTETITKQDKIKSLVSDWDDDEEEKE